MTDDPRQERMARLIAELEALPYEEREAAIAGLSEEDRETVWASELEEADEAVPDDYEDLGTGD